MTVLQALIGEYAAGEPELVIWQRNPDISRAQDASADGFVCRKVSAGFAELAVLAEGAELPLAGDHVSLRINHSGRK